MRWVRAKAEQWRIDRDRVGMLGFSAGGQVASVLLTCGNEAAYPSRDAIDQQSFRPSFMMLVYPWNVLVPKTDSLMPELKFFQRLASDVHRSYFGRSIFGGRRCHDLCGFEEVRSSSELHIYENGGHGYGTRPRPDSNIGTWPDRAVDWLVRRGLGTKS